MEPCRHEATILISESHHPLVRRGTRLLFPKSSWVINAKRAESPRNFLEEHFPRVVTYIGSSTCRLVDRRYVPSVYTFLKQGVSPFDGCIVDMESGYVRKANVSNLGSRGLQKAVFP